MRKVKKMLRCKFIKTSFNEQKAKSNSNQLFVHLQDYYNIIAKKCVRLEINRSIENNNNR